MEKDLSKKEIEELKVFCKSKNLQYEII